MLCFNFLECPRVEFDPAQAKTRNRETSIGPVPRTSGRGEGLGVVITRAIVLCFRNTHHMIDRSCVAGRTAGYEGEIWPNLGDFPLG